VKAGGGGTCEDGKAKVSLRGNWQNVDSGAGSERERGKDMGNTPHGGSQPKTSKRPSKPQSAHSFERGKGT